MVLPLLPVAAAAIAGLFGGSLLGGLPDIGTEYHAEKEHYQPQITYAPVTSIQHPDYQIMIESPMGVQTSKKAMKTTSDVSPEQSYEPSTAEGIPIVPIAILAAITFIGVSYVKGK